MISPRYPSWLFLMSLLLCCATVHETTAQTTDAFSQSATETELINPFLTLDYSSFAAGQFSLPTRRRYQSSEVFVNTATTESDSQSTAVEPTATIQPAPILPEPEQQVSDPNFSSPSFVEEAPVNFSKEAPTTSDSPDSPVEDTSVEMPTSPPPVSSSARPPFRPRVRSPFRPPPIPVFGC